MRDWRKEGRVCVCAFNGHGTVSGEIATERDFFEVRLDRSFSGGGRFCGLRWLILGVDFRME